MSSRTEMMLSCFKFQIGDLFLTKPRKIMLAHTKNPSLIMRFILDNYETANHLL